MGKIVSSYTLIGELVFLQNAGKTLLMWASSRLDLNTNQNGNYETRNEVNFEEGNFPALGSNYDWRVQAHHLVTGNNAPHNCIPD